MNVLLNPGHRLYFGICLSAMLITGCMSQKDVLTVDLRTQSGVYVVGYSSDATIRTDFEDQLVQDLSKLDMRAVPSHQDLPRISVTSARDVVRLATQHQLLAIVVVNQLDEPVVSTDRAIIEHPTVKAFFDGMKHGLDDADREEVIVEVNGYLIDKDVASHVWSGVSAVYDVEDRRQAIASLSSSVAAALKEAQNEIRPVNASAK